MTARFVVYLMHSTSDEAYNNPVEFDAANRDEAIGVAQQHVREHPAAHVVGDLYRSDDGRLVSLGQVTR